MKIVYINSCGECPYFDYQYYSYNEKCTMLNRKIEGGSYGYTIPEDCPLEDSK